MDLSIIIVNWNSKAYLRQCLDSLARHCTLAHTQTIVVDSGSFDGCDRMIAEEFRGVKFVQSAQNIGFARANNLGVQHANGEHLLFLNPDTLFLEDSLRILNQRLAELPRAGAVGCRLLNQDHSVQTSCIQSFPTVTNQVLDADYLRDRFPRSRLWGNSPLFDAQLEPCEVDALSGACLAVTREAFEQIGGFTESYFMYGEDLDLCFKLQRSGYKVYYLPETRIVHLGGGSSRQAPSNFSIVRMRDSIYHFFQIHRGPGAAFCYRFAMGAAAIVRLGLIQLTPLLDRGAIRHRGDALRKWASILRWSLGLNTPPDAN
jgi:GT2 family glycosyltransferase